MRKLLLIAGMIAMTAPGLAMAQPSCHQAKEDNRVAGTVSAPGRRAIGGSIGRGPGAVAGAVGGGVVGNVAGGNSVHCDQTGYYDLNGVGIRRTAIMTPTAAGSRTCRRTATTTVTAAGWRPRRPATAPTCPTPADPAISMAGKTG